MNQSEKTRIDDVTHVVNDLLKGSHPTRLNAEGQPDDEIRQLATLVNRLTDALKSTTLFAQDLSKGKLRTELRCQLALGGALKSLQVSLQHLTWQADQIARGDFSQRVDFLGEFSAAFNQMIQQLQCDRGRLLRQERDLQQYANDLRQALRAAESAIVAKSVFLANMSHEIRTPLTAILGFTDLVLDACPARCEFGRTELCEHLGTVKRNGEHLLNIINDILDLAKIEAGRMTVEELPCSPREIVTDVISMLKVGAAGKGLDLVFTLSDSVPDRVWTDPTRLRQILINLVGNAVKFTDRGHVRVEADIIGGDRSQLLQFDVIDTGPGMAREEAARVFRPFTQADESMVRRHGGTGLGLTVSKRLAEMLGGDVELVDSMPGKGSRFRATVAAKCADEPATRRTSRQPIVTPQERNGTRLPAKALDGLRVLLAEDGPDNQRLIALVLRKAGAEVVVVENGRVAVEQATSQRNAGKPFDVVLMDMQMPVMDGYEATGKLRRENYNGPIIALTAHAMASDREKCIQAGCDGYAAKPIVRERLIETILRYARGTPDSATSRT